MIAPRTALPNFTLKDQARFAGIVGHLHGKNASRRQCFQYAPHHRPVLGQPLQHGIAEDEIGGRLGCPRRNVGLHEFAVRQPFARFAQHVGRGIKSDHFGLRKTLDEKLGGIARPAAEVDHKARLLQRHLREQVARRAGALVLEFKVLPRAPVFHALPCGLRLPLGFAYSASPSRRRSLCLCGRRWLSPSCYRSPPALSVFQQQRKESVSQSPATTLIMWAEQKCPATVQSRSSFVHCGRIRLPKLSLSMPPTIRSTRRSSTILA